MEINKEVYKFYQEQAKKEANAIHGYYDEVRHFTKPFYSTEYGQISRNARHTNMFILNCVEDFTNYIMNTLLPRGSKWGKITADENLLPYVINADNPILLKKRSEEVNRLLETVTDKTFHYLDASNYFEEIYNAVWDCVTLGTGCIKIKDTGNPVKPFIFQTQGLENITFLEDAFGKVKYIFKEHRHMNYTMFKELFPAGKWIDSDESVSREYDFIEIVIPCVGEKFHHFVCSPDMDVIMFEQILNYNPFIVFRFRKHEFISWGVGNGLHCLDYFRDLEEATRLDREQIANVITPALIGYGDKNLFNALKVKAGTINFGGLEGTPQSLNVKQIIPDARINVLADQIDRIKADISKAFMVNPLGNIEDRTAMTATESQIRSQQFRETFSGVYERFVMELLEPIIISCVKILMSNGVVELESKIIDISKIMFINSITESALFAEVEKLVRVVTVSMQILGESAPQLLINKERIRDFLIDKTGVAIAPMNTTEEIQVMLEEQKQMQLQQQDAMAQQQQQQQQTHDLNMEKGFNDIIGQGTN